MIVIFSLVDVSWCRSWFCSKEILLFRVNYFNAPGENSFICCEVQLAEVSCMLCQFLSNLLYRNKITYKESLYDHE